MKKHCINPKNLFDSKQFGFSQIVVSNPGKMVYISGQVAWDEHMSVVGKHDLAKQTEQSLNNLSLAIQAAGGRLEHVVMLRIYLVNYRQEDSPIVSEILKKHFGSNPPSSTWVHVNGLANEDFLIEIEAQAVI